MLETLWPRVFSTRWRQGHSPLPPDDSVSGSSLLTLPSPFGEVRDRESCEITSLSLIRCLSFPHSLPPFLTPLPLSLSLSLPPRISSPQTPSFTVDVNTFALSLFPYTSREQFVVWEEKDNSSDNNDRYIHMALLICLEPTDTKWNIYAFLHCMRPIVQFHI